MSELLTYFVSERNGIVVISFVGSLVRGSMGLLAKLIAETSARRPRMVIFNCHDLQEVDATAAQAFAELQSCVRDMPAELRLCFVRSELRQVLSAQNALRPEESKNNLLDAVGEFLNAKKAA